MITSEVAHILQCLEPYPRSFWGHNYVSLFEGDSCVYPGETTTEEKLAPLVTEGLLSKFRFPTGTHSYRATDKGREHLAEYLRGGST